MKTALHSSCRTWDINSDPCRVSDFLATTSAGFAIYDMSLNPKRASSLFKRSTTSGGNVATLPVHPEDPGEKGQTVTDSNAPKALKEFREQVKKGLPISLSTSSMAAVVDLIRHKDSLDDRKLLLEHALVFVSRLQDGHIARTLKSKIIMLLYNDLCHPPATIISNKYAWRTADGSYNNIDIPDLGKSGTPYSRSVQQTHLLPKSQLPDAGLLFDVLLRRKGFVSHPGGLSSLMFNFATLVIHSVFRTSHRDVTINETSSYVDLGPLYGNNQQEQDRVRIRDGKGMLHPDTFSEDRLLLLPPGVCTLLVLFNRNHNYIAAKLLEINERGTFVDPATLSGDDPASKVKLLAQEEEIFQTARLINCGWFGMVVFSDYFSSILGLVREGNSWSLTPFDEIRKDDHSVFERGKGNSCSVEFNCLYRWHATTSQEDEQWVEEKFKELFGEKPFDQVTVSDFKLAAMKLQKEQEDVTRWTFGNMKRQQDGKFKDEDLANILQNATEHPAAAFRARGTPGAMRLNEIMGIEQSRAWGVCSLNEFRKFLGLKPFTSFSQWNSDPEIATAAERLYGDIDRLELYVGLQAEEAKPLVDGAGLCPGYTISRAILSDAIALTRGDRHFTHDFTPYNLTAWGFVDCQRDPNAFGFGSILGRLILRTLPNHFTENSTYAFFPLMTPASMKTILTKLDVIDQYDLSRPKPKPPVVVCQGHSDVSAILRDKQNFVVPYASRASRIIGGTGFFPAENDKEHQAIVTVLSSPDLVKGIGQYFYENTKKSIEGNGYVLVGDKVFGVDLVRHVLRSVPISWAATELAGIRLKNESSGAIYGASDLYDALADIYEYIFLDTEASKVMVLEKKCKKHVATLTQLIRNNLDGEVGSKPVSRIIGAMSKSKKTEHHDIVKRLYELGHSKDQLTNTLLALMVSTVELSLVITNVVNFFLGTEHEKTIASLAKDPNGKAQLDGYVYEALRLDPTFCGVFRVAHEDQSVSGKECKKGARVFVDVHSANLDGAVFTNATTFDPKRATKDCLYPDGVFSYLGEGLTTRITCEVLRAIFEYHNVRRAPGQSGVLHRLKNPDRAQVNYMHLNKAQNMTPWPQSMSILFDAQK